MTFSGYTFETIIVRVQQRDCTGYLLTGLFLLCDVVSLVNVSESVLVMLADFRMLSTSDSFTGDSKLPERYIDFYNSKHAC